MYGFDKSAPERLWIMVKNYASWISATASSATPRSST
jgi:ABC-type microcin C transport system permease subunit YejB